MSAERGYTLIELLIGATISIVVLGGILTVVQAATRSQDRTAERVAANQRGRPAMTRLIDRLHSACVSPELAPVRTGSDADSMILISKSGADVTPVPDKYVISLAGGTLTETIYPGTGGEPEEWTFGSPTERQILTGVSAGDEGEPPASVPLFRYYAYEDADEDGEVETVELSPPLDEAEAARTVEVAVAFAVAPNASGSAYAGSEITLTDSATLRIEPASEDSAEVNLPCV